MTDPGFLAVTPHAGPTRNLLADAARRRGMDVVELTAPSTATALRGRPGAHFYGGPALGATVAPDLGVALLEPPDDWLPGLAWEFTRRTIHATTLGEARRLPGPVFVKPPRDKTFPAAVYETGEALPDGPDEWPALVSEVVHWQAEFRVYILDGEIRTGAQYATHGTLDVRGLKNHHHNPAVVDFTTNLLSVHGSDLPSAVVVDIGLVEGEWAVVEANMPWFSTVYAADPARALDVTLRAAGPREAVRDRDRSFVRTPRA